MKYEPTKTDIECNKLFANKFLRKLDHPLFHYTSDASAKSIHSSKEIWLTHYKHFSDKTEFFKGFDIIIGFLEEECRKNSSFKFYYEKFLIFLKGERETFGKETKEHIQMHVMCFCHRKTNSYLKRNYHKGKKLHLLEFEFSFEDLGIKPIFIDVIYSRRIFKKHIDKLFYRYGFYLYKNQGKDGFDINSFFPSLIKDVFLLAISFKHHKYSVEEEIRCVKFLVGNEVKFHKEPIPKSKITIHENP